jgi:hypothetical protein
MLKRAWKAIFGAWETEKDDGMFLHQRHSRTGATRYSVPGWRMRALRPWHRPKDMSTSKRT